MVYERARLIASTALESGPRISLALEVVLIPLLSNEKKSFSLNLLKDSLAESLILFSDISVLSATVWQFYLVKSKAISNN